MTLMPPGNSNPAVIRYKDSLGTLKDCLAKLYEVKVDDFYCEVKHEVIDGAIAEFKRAIAECEGEIIKGGGTICLIGAKVQ